MWGKGCVLSPFSFLDAMNDMSHIPDEALSRIAGADSLDALEQIRVHLLGKTGLVTEQLKSLGKLAPDERKARGAQINALKEQLQNAIGARKSALEDVAFAARLAAERVDVTMPGRHAELGTIHPVT